MQKARRGPTGREASCLALSQGFHPGLFSNLPYGKTLFARCLPHVVAHLQFVPEAIVGAERGGEAQSHVGGDTRRAIENAREGRAGDVERLCRGGDVDVAERVAENLAGVGRVENSSCHDVDPIS